MTASSPSAPAPALDTLLGELPRAAFLALPVKAQLERLEQAIRGLPDEGLRAVARDCRDELARPFLPIPGPQAAARLSDADILVYGGQAGGGKSHLLVGCASEHQRSAIFRRESTELDGLIAASHDMYGRDGWRGEGNGGTHSLPGFQIRFGGMKEPDDWRHFAGRARDFIGFDEGGEFLEMQVRALLAWLRSPDAEQRCRIIIATNPPRSADGAWLLEWIAPWIDPSFADPAAPGELRWAIFVDDELRWVDGPAQVTAGGKGYTPLSITFIPAALGDNPLQDQEGYRARLSSLPEPLRSQLIEGNFLAGRSDDDWQVIPSDWIKAAQDRWTERGPRDEPNFAVPMTCLGVDVAQGGKDRTVRAPRHGRWFGPLKVSKGVDTKNGPAVAGLVVGEMRDGCTVAVDLGGGWGGSAYDHLQDTLREDGAVVGFKPSEGSTARRRDGAYGFCNKRAEAVWKLREALDPETGDGLCLPPPTIEHGAALAAELAMPRFLIRGGNILIESKDDIKKRLKRSPDLADAVVIAHHHGDERAANRFAPQRRQQTANLGYAAAKFRTIQGGRSGKAYGGSGASAGLPQRANSGLQRRY